MYYCMECKNEFQNSVKIYEKHSLSSPPYESIYVCPYCKSGNFVEIKVKHCKCCGAKIYSNDQDYCSNACKLRGEKLWRKEAERKKLLNDSPLYKLVREVDSYNKIHSTKLSYGQYVAIIKRGKKNAEK